MNEDNPDFQKFLKFKDNICNFLETQVVEFEYDRTKILKDGTSIMMRLMFKQNDILDDSINFAISVAEMCFVQETSRRIEND